MPSPDHLLGTDQFGRDVLAMVVSATSVSLQIGAIAGVISTVVGVIVAFVAGYKGGWIDGVLSTFTGILLVIPTFPLLIALSAYAKNVSLFQVGVMISIFSWPFAAKTIRSQVLSLRITPVRRPGAGEQGPRPGDHRHRAAAEPAAVHRRRLRVVGARRDLRSGRPGGDRSRARSA